LPVRESEAANLGLHRVMTILAAVGLFGAALVSWNSIIQVPLVGVASVVGFGAILVVVIAATSARTATELERLDVVILVLGLVLMVAWAVSQLYFYPAYGTDEAAYTQYASQLLIHGQNPYAHSLLPALAEFRVPIQYATYTLNGSISSSLAYPSLPVLIGVPFVLLTHGVQSIICANVLFLGIEMVLLFTFLPRRIRGLAPIIVLGLPMLFGYTASGVNDTLLAPFLLVVAYGWADVGGEGRLGRSGLLRAICFGLALSVQQLAWFILPFVLLGTWHLRRRELGSSGATKVVSRYAGVAFATFLLVNGPFIVWGPKAWVDGVLAPLTQHAIPYGQGLIDATVFFHIGGGDLTQYTYGAASVMVALLVVYSLYFDRLWRAAFILPSAALFFPTRSLAEYFVTVIAIWTVSLVSPGSGPVAMVDSIGRDLEPPTPASQALARQQSIQRRLRRALVIGSFVPGTMFLFFALGTPQPLSLQIRSIETNGQLQGVWRIEVRATNHSTNTLQPHFAPNYIGQMTSFWHITSGPPSLHPGQSALYTLAAPNVGSMPGITQRFVLQAVSAQPQTISSSALFTPEGFDCYITPSYVDAVNPLGHSVNLQVQLRFPYGGADREQGVRVALGQLIYGQNALIPAEARINGMPPGQTPVTARTNAAGIAVFHVSDDKTQGGNPIYFQADVAPVHGYPYGYSEVVSVLWR
jgi:uncharacterized membrane protein